MPVPAALSHATVQPRVWSSIILLRSVPRLTLSFSPTALCEPLFLPSLVSPCQPIGSASPTARSPTKRTRTGLIPDCVGPQTSSFLADALPLLDTCRCSPRFPQHPAFNRPRQPGRVLASAPDLPPPNPTHASIDPNSRNKLHTSPTDNFGGMHRDAIVCACTRLPSVA